MPRAVDIIQIPEGIEVNINLGMIIVKGPKGELKRKYPTNILKIEVKDSKVTVNTVAEERATNRAVVGTFRAHIRNMISGVQEPFIYKLKICSTHFPISAKLQGNELQVQNYFGGKKPKIFSASEKVKMNIDGDIITIESIDKELAGQTAASIEKIAKPKGRDKRIFQDGIYIIEKAGKPI